MEKKDEIISIRISSQLKEKLLKDSQEKKISLNTSLNQIISDHVNWNKFMSELGMLYTTKKIYEDMFSKINDDDLKDIALNSFKSGIKNTAAFVYHDFNFTTLVEAMESWSRSADMHFTHLNGENEKFIIHHPLGKKYSKCLYICLESLLSELDYKTKDPRIENDGLIFELIKNN
ncbi:MAG: exodeoxyribonuclease V beta chain [Marine Group I thaumarchaeote]|nr:MAG: exodeoxyribonuclease V beta chain [Marine Group I thaumarchaeote]